MYRLVMFHHGPFSPFMICIATQKAVADVRTELMMSIFLKGTRLQVGSAWEQE